MPDVKLLVLQMAAILAAARLAALAFRKIRQPAVIGEIFAGILLGPSLLGRIAPSVMNGLFPADHLGSLYALSQLGLILFMFLVGLELRPESLRGVGRAAFIASQASIVAPLVCGGILAWAFYPQLGGGAEKLPFVLFMAAAMSVTAFPVLARILTDRQLTHTRAGALAISIAAFTDVTAWFLLAIITVIARHDAALSASAQSLPSRFTGLIAYAAAMFFIARPALRRIFPDDAAPNLNRFGIAMIVLLGSVWATEALGVHALFGAFLAGLAVPKRPRLQEGLRERIESVTVVLLLPLFFAFAGLRTNVGLLSSAEMWLSCAMVVIVAVGSKMVVAAAAARACGVSRRESLAVGILVNTRGLVELVILNVGLELHILSPTVYSMMVIMALVTTLMTAPLIDRVGPLE